MTPATSVEKSIARRNLRAPFACVVFLSFSRSLAIESNFLKTLE